MKIRAALVLLLAIGCSKTSERPGSSASGEPTPPPSATPAPPPTPTPTPELSWDVPAKWQTVPSPSPMRKATYKIPKVASDPEDAEMSVTQAGGSIDANIDRWIGQLGATKDAVKRTDQKVGPFKVTIVDIKGTFQGSGMPGAPAASPKEHWELTGAIVEGTDPPHFFKLIGPEKTVTAARADFDRLVGSLRAK